MSGRQVISDQLTRFINQTYMVVLSVWVQILNWYPTGAEGFTPSMFDFFIFVVSLKPGHDPTFNAFVSDAESKWWKGSTERRMPHHCGCRQCKLAASNPKG